MGLKDEFPLEMGDVQGRTVNLPEGTSYVNQLKSVKITISTDCLGF